MLLRSHIVVEFKHRTNTYVSILESGQTLFILCQNLQLLIVSHHQLLSQTKRIAITSVRISTENKIVLIHTMFESEKNIIFLCSSYSWTHKGPTNFN